MIHISGIHISRVVGRACVAGLIIAASAVMASSGHATAQATGRQAALLPLSPLSGSVLMAQALRSGAIHLPSAPPTQDGAAPALTCSPAPCILPNVQASGGGQPVNETPIAVNPSNAQQWITGGNDYNCASLQGFYVTGDGGKTWQRSCLPTLSGMSGSGDPVVGYDRHNTVYRGGIDTISSNNGVIVIQKSTDNGVTWAAPVVAVNPTLGGLTDKPWLEIDTSAASPYSNALYMSVTQFDQNIYTPSTQISVSHSRDGGTTWTTAAVDPAQSYPTVDQFSDLAIGRDGTVYVSWMRCTASGSGCGGTNATMLFAKSGDGGTTWSTPITIASVTLASSSCGYGFYGCLPNTNERVSDIPALAIDRSTGPNAGSLYAVMYTWTGTFMSVEVAASHDGGTTWATPVPVSPASVTHDQFFPWLSVGSTGNVGVSWLDRRDDSLNISYRTYVAFSTNGGATFSKNQPITRQLSNPSYDGFGGTFMGDYTGNAFAAKAFLVSWPDTRNKVNAQHENGGVLFR